MPDISPEMMRPPSRFLHDPALRDEVLKRLSANWPSKPPNWTEVRDHLSSRLGLPKAAIPGLPARRPIPGVAPPERFRPELVEVPDFALESVVLPLARPTLLVQDNDFANAPLEYWQQRLNAARAKIKQCIREVGRVELKNHDRLEWNGTAWRVRPTVAVTNAHVAQEFVARKGAKWVFRTNSSGKSIHSRIDFKEEYDRPEEEELAVTDILYLEEGDGPDMALLQVEGGPEHNPGIELADNVAPNCEVVAIGYPKYDSSVPDPDILVSIFGGIYDVKRLSPGVINGADARLLQHDCSTLGGSSGSAIVDLATGRAMGLHFGGAYTISNYAVPAPVITARLAQLGL
jgi:endonuclease G